jgi:transposase InsO family protein
VSFLEALFKAVPYRLHTILTDNGIQFADQPRNRDGWAACHRIHRFDQICTENGIEHRLTKPNHPWTNGQVERMNRTIKDATVKRYYYENRDQLRQHLQLFIDAYNYGRRLETLIGLTPFEYVARIWTEEPTRFKIALYNHSAGLNT